MAAALGRDLVLEEDSGRAGGGVAEHCAADVRGRRAARVAVGDEGDGQRLGDGEDRVAHLCVGQQIRVGVAARRGDGEARHEGEGEAGAVDEAGCERVVAARHLEKGGGREEGAEDGGFGGSGGGGGRCPAFLRGGASRESGESGVEEGCHDCPGMVRA